MTKQLKDFVVTDFFNITMFEFIKHLLKNDTEWDLTKYDSISEISVELNNDYYEVIEGYGVTFTLFMTDDMELVISDARERVCEYKIIDFKTH